MQKINSTLLLIGIMILGLAIYPSSSQARVDVHVGVSLPSLVISAEPELVVIPGTYVYFCPDVQEDLFFYDGYWFRTYEGNWYRSVDYNGPWVYIVYTEVPSPVIHLPRDFRTEAVDAPHIAYRELKGNWRAWERDKHWDKVGWGRRPGMEQGREHGVAPSFEEHGHQPGTAPNRREQANPPASRRHEMSAPPQHRETGVAPQFREEQRPSGPHREMSAPTSREGHPGAAPNRKEERR